MWTFSPMSRYFLSGILENLTRFMRFAVLKKDTTKPLLIF